MPLPYHPRPGTIVVCDYSSGFIEPEMIKKRLAITISPRLRKRDNLISVVPLSSTAPKETQAWHYRLDIDVPHWGEQPRWAKCDMIATVCFERLNLPHQKHPLTGARKYAQIELSDVQVADLRAAVAAALGLH